MKTAKKLLALLLAFIIAMSCAAVASAAADEETESNATPTSANLIGVGGAMNAKLEDPKDVDWFTFESTANGLATVKLDHTAITGADSNVSFFKVEIIGEDGVYVESFKSAGNQASASVSFSVIPSDYFIKVSMDRQHIDNLTYTLKVDIDKSANVEKEENDTFGDATFMNTATKAKPDLTYFGTIDKGSEASGDIDYYKFFVGETTMIYPSIYNTATNTGRYKLSVLDTVTGKDGVAVERVLGTIIISANESQIDGGAIGVKAGTYYVRISGVDNTVGGYQFRIYTSPSSNTETEFNNTVKDANDIYVGSKITGCLFDETDKDIFTFVTKGNNSGYKLNLKAYSSKIKNPNGQWSVVVKNSSDGQVCKMDVLASTAGELTIEPLPAGEYFIYVNKGNVFTSDVYLLEFASLPKSDDDKEEEPVEGTLIDRIVAFGERLSTLPWMEFIDPIMQVLKGMDLEGILGMGTDLGVSIGKFLPFLPEILEHFFANIFGGGAA